MIFGPLKALCTVERFGWAQRAPVVKRLGRRSRVSRETSFPFRVGQNCPSRRHGVLALLKSPRRRQDCLAARCVLQCLSMIARNTVRELLGPFEVILSDSDIDRLLVYLALLLRWNQKINLTSIRTPEECITRHFGESFFLASAVPLRGRLLDIGSGAGFPGLALKLLTPDLEVVLLEPVAKKRAFLKEVARTCGMSSVRVMGNRFEEFSKQEEPHSFDMVTARAVGGLESLIPAAGRLLKAEGDLCLWVGSQQVEEIGKMDTEFRWLESVPIPLSQERKILVGKTRRHE